MVADNIASLIAQKPVKWSSVSLAEVIGHGKRLEASVYDIEARQARQQINLCNYGVTAMEKLCHSYVCNRFKRIWVEKSNCPIFQPSSIADIKPIADGYISKLTHTNIDNLRVHKGQILMTCSGTIGKVCVVSNSLDKQIFSHDLLRIEPYSQSDMGYIYAYLKTNVGNKILLSNKYGAVITHIEPEHLATVPVPNAPEEIKNKINDLIVRSYDLRDKSNELLDKATAMLISELHLPPIEEFEKADFTKSQKVKTFTTRLCDLNRRLDASYHIPTVSAITKHLEKYAQEVITVGNDRVSSAIVLPGRFKRVYVENGYGKVFIGGKQIYELDPTNKKYLSLTHHEKRIKDQLELHKNMTLITCSGTIGKVALVAQHWENWAASQHIIRVIPANNDIAGYLNLFLASEYGEKLITRCTYGSVVDEIDNNHVASIPFPLLKTKEAQKEINDMALHANDLRYQAYLLEQEALKALNDEVIYAK